MNSSKKSLNFGRVGSLLLGSIVFSAASILAIPNLPEQKAVAQLVPMRLQGSRIVSVVKLRRSVAQITQANAFIPLATASTNIVVPNTVDRAIIDARFIAESACYPVNPALAVGYCSVRILLNGVEMAPVTGPDFAFDSSNVGTERFDSKEAHAMDRSSRQTVPPGNYTVTVQWGIVGGAANNTNFWLDDWHLVLDAVSVP